MGLFNFLKYNSTEKALLNKYSQIVSMTGLPSAEAKKVVGHLMLDKAIHDSKNDGTYYLPQNLGDIVLGDTRSDNPAFQKLAETIKQKLPRIRNEGVRDEDIRWWWNLCNVERCMMLECENFFKSALFLSEAQNSNASAAGIKVRKFHPVYDPIYGDPIYTTDTIQLTGDDKPLPCELKNRINIYIDKRAMGAAEKYKNEIEQSSSFNALIRREIKAGNL